MSLVAGHTPHLSVRECEDTRAWDAFVHGAEFGSHAHLAAWKTVIERAMGQRSRMLAAVDDTGAIHGVLPIADVRSLLFGRHFVSMPYLNYGGLLGTQDAQRTLAEYISEEAQRDGVRSVLIRGREAQLAPWEASTPKVTVVRDLPDSSEKLLAEFNAKLRSQVKRALKDGATFHSGPDQLDAFYSVFRRHMRDLGTPVMPRRFFSEILHAFPESVRVASVRHNGIAIAGGFGFRWHDEFEITWASSLMTHKHLSPNMLLYWGMLGACIDEGVRRFDFGRCTPGSGTHKFKLQWGGHEIPMHWYYPGSSSQALPQKEQRGYAIAAQLWKNLPVPLTSWLGPRIVRGIP